MKFNELSEQDKIQYIKDSFVLILEQLAKDPSKIKIYIKPMDKPKPVKAILEKAIDSMSEEQKKEIQERNALAEANAHAESARLEEAYNTNQEHIKKIENMISKLKKIECICGTCINVSITNSLLPPEFQVLVEAAKKDAEERVY